jgi:hypothetical protein
MRSLGKPEQAPLSAHSLILKPKTHLRGFAPRFFLFPQNKKLCYTRSMENEQAQERQCRWYDKDPILKEALELLRLSDDEEKDAAKDFILKLQEDVAADVIERIYDIITSYHGKGSRWYDNDPVMIKAIEILRNADPKTQRKAALKLLVALEEKSSDAVGEE